MDPCSDQIPINDQSHGQLLSELVPSAVLVLHRIEHKLTVQPIVLRSLLSCLQFQIWNSFLERKCQRQWCPYAKSDLPLLPVWRLDLAKPMHQTVFFRDCTPSLPAENSNLLSFFQVHRLKLPREVHLCKVEFSRCFLKGYRRSCSSKDFTSWCNFPFSALNYKGLIEFEYIEMLVNNFHHGEFYEETPD